jgi:hypothetical protein
VKPLTAEEWVGLLEGVGLRDIVAQTYPVNARYETRALLRPYGGGGMVRVMLRELALYARNPAYQRFVRGVGEGGLIPQNLGEYFGYGIYVGRQQL